MRNTSILAFVLSAAILVVAGCGGTSDKSSRHAVKDSSGLVFPIGVPNTAYAQYFTGDSFISPIGEGDKQIVNVTFEPGCRNNWHIHRGGQQYLVCVAGAGWYQEEGKPARALKFGDIVEIPAGVKHWHGAAAGSWFQHLVFTSPAEGVTTEWLEPVTDEQYGQLL